LVVFIWTGEQEKKSQKQTKPRRWNRVRGEEKRGLGMLRKRGMKTHKIWSHPNYGSSKGGATGAGGGKQNRGKKGILEDIYSFQFSDM